MVDIITFEITNIFGRISTSILHKQRYEVANLAKYVYLQGLCTFQMNISVTKYGLFYTKSAIIYLVKHQLCSYQKDLGKKLQ